MSETVVMETAMAEEWIAAPNADAYYGLAGDFVRLTEPETESSQVALLGNFLVIAGTLFGRVAHCYADGRTHFPAEFLTLVGDTGRSRKGTSSAHGLRIADGVEESFRKNHVKAGLSTGEGLIKAMSKGKELGVDRFLCMLPEFGSVLTVCKREGNTISAVMRQSWDADPLEVPTKTNPLSVSDYFLSLICHVTPEELLNGLASIDLVNGLANRFLFCKVKRSKFLPEGGKPVNTGLIVSRLRDAVLAAQHRGLMQRNDEAKALWADVYPKLADQPKGLKGALCSRAEAHTLRLSLIYALLDGASEIRLEHLKAGLAFWDYCERSVADVFAARLGDLDAEKILRAVATGPKTLTEIHKAFGNHQSSEWLLAKLGAMVANGQLVRTQKECDRKNVQAWAKKI